MAPRRKGRYPDSRCPNCPKWRPCDAALLAGWVLEKLHTLLRRDDEPRMTRFVARQLSTAHWFDISAAKRDLGYRPEVSMEEGLRRLEESFATG